MDKELKEILKDVKTAVAASADSGTKPYDTTATVVRVDGSTAWVHIPGGVDETPVSKSIDCAAGDTVRVRISGGKAWITGNDSAPPTDDTAANTAKATADSAASTAKAAADVVGKQQNHFWHDDGGAHVKGMTDGYQTTVNAHGLSVENSDGKEMAFFGVDEDGDSIATIGATDEAHQEMDYRSLSLIDKEKTPFFEVKDLRDKTGVAVLESTHYGDGKTVEFSTNWYIVEIEGIIIDGDAYPTDSVTVDSSHVVFDSPPADGATIVITFTANSRFLKSITFGTRGEQSKEGGMSFVNGIECVASGSESHAEGWWTKATGMCSHAEGWGTKAQYDYQHVIGAFNENLEEDLFEVGNGSLGGNYKNAFRVTRKGEIYAEGGVYSGGVNILEKVYPIGSIYMSTNNASPEMLFGGKWERIQDRFLLAAGETYSAGNMDGEATHTLTADELPDHRHTFTTDSAGDHTHSLNRVLGNSGGNWTGDTAGNLSGSGRKFGYIDPDYTIKTVTDTGSGGAHTHSGTTNGTGGNGKHNNMPPYLVVNVWERTA